MSVPAWRQARIEVIAHRGASAIAPENTLAAVEAAIELGADRVEVDVRRSRDGELFLMHDLTVGRTTDGGATPIGELDAEELRRLDAGGWFSQDFAGEPVAPLKEVLAATMRRVGLLIEVKNPKLYPGIARDVVAAIEGASNVMVQSFRFPFLKRLRAIDDSVPLAWLVYKVPESLASVKHHVDVLAVRHEALTEPQVAAMHRAGLRVYTWTVNDAKRIAELQRIGVDGIVTDHPNRMTALRS